MFFLKSNIPITILIRHLPTVDDNKNLLTPYDDDVVLLPVNEDYLKKMAECIEKISELTRRNVCFNTSPLQRGVKMAKILNSYMTSQGMIELDDRWCNIHQGDIAGLSQETFRKEALWRNWHERPNLTSFPNGESLYQVQTRINEMISLISRNNCINVIISHTTPLQVILTSLLGIELKYIWRFYFEHYSMTIIVNDILLCANTKDPDLDGLRKLVINDE